MNELTPNGDAFTEIVLEVFRLNRLLLDAGDTLTAPVGLSSARWQVMGVVEHGPIPVSNVARIMGLTRQSVQQTADGLAADGLITWSENPHHRRAKLMSPTDAGREAMAYVTARQAEWANGVSATRELNELRATLATLRRLRATLDPDASPPPGASSGTQDAGV
jgi:DNA-binding MarR family transcriptional regulator